MEQAIGYVRVSSEEQSREGFSLDAQEARIRSYAEMRGLALIDVYREEAVSAKMPLKKRPEGAKIVELLGKRRARHVIAVKLDRLFRNTADALNQTEQWDKAKLALHVIDMGGSTIDTTSAMGRMFFTMAAAFAEMERNLTSERTKAALLHKKSTGGVYCRYTPFGFDRHDDALLPNEGEMQIVAEVRTMRERGTSLHKIAEQLNRTQTPTKRGGVWHAVTVRSLLRIHQGSQQQ